MIIESNKGLLVRAYIRMPNPVGLIDPMEGSDTGVLIIKNRREKLFLKFREML
tara:strand:- start:255 stop:413 length:159 start_codon:yes stop_codon:yes gene_type:complete